MSDSTPGASIVYSLDGGATYQSYTTAIVVTGNGTTQSIKAKATAPGYSVSSVTSQTYTISYLTVSTVTFSPVGGTFVADQLVSLSDATPGAVIQYSVDGGTTFSTYSSPILVTGNGTSTTIQARAIKTGMLTSGVTSQTYTIQYSGVTINFAVPTDPVIFGATSVVLNGTAGDSMTVSLASPSAFTTYSWLIDGHTGVYQMGPGWVYNGQPFAYSGNSLIVESQYMKVGNHEVMVIVSDATGTYSARFVVGVLQ